MEKIKMTQRRNSFIWLCVFALIMVGVTSIGYSMFYGINYLEIFRIGCSEIFRIDFSEPVEAFSEKGTKYFREFIAASLVSSIAVGLRFGRIVANGLAFNGRAIKAIKPSFEVAITHPDRTGGLARIGTFYFWQASTVIISIIWFLIWFMLFYLGYYDKYLYWETYFMILQIFIVVFFLLGFLWPVWFFRQLMISWKESNITPLISSMRMDLRALRRDCRRDSSKIPQLRQLANDLHSLISLPCWPVSPATWRRFWSTVATVVTGLVTSVIANFLAR